MADTDFQDTAKTGAAADAATSDLQRAIAGVDRFNPMYFRALSAILLSISFISIGLALQGFPSLDISQLFYLMAAILGTPAAGLTLIETRKYTTRWKRAQDGLNRALRDAERIASFGLVTIDKGRAAEGDLNQIKHKYLMLTYAIRDARERLGLKD